MLLFLEGTNLTGLLVSLPESLGLLVFGVGLIGLAILIRWLIDRIPASRNGEKTTKKA